MFTCNVCHTTFKTIHSLNGHQKIHKESYVKPNNLSKNSKEQKLARINEYIKNPKKCLFCDKILPYDKRKLDFCNHSCSSKTNNKLRDSRTMESRLKTSKSIKLYNLKNPKPVKEKLVYNNICKYCGKTFTSSSLKKKVLF